MTMKNSKNLKGEVINLNTALGILSVKIDRNEEYPNILLMLNNIPVAMVEQFNESGKSTLYLKNYNNPNVKNATDFINYNKYKITAHLKEKY